jgi:RND family efflux transporter MFP subunit
LLTLMDQSTVTVRAKIPLQNLQQVKLGEAVQVTPSALPNLNLTGSVVSIIPQADPQTDTFEVWVNIVNTQQTLLPGMSAFVRIQSPQNAFSLPRISVLNPDRESVVFIVRNGHTYMQPVHVAGNAPGVFIVDSGLSARDQIVVLPLNRLHNGQAVSITSVEH